MTAAPTSMTPGATSAETGRRASYRTQIIGLSLLAAWTLFIWVTRVRNILGDDELSGWAMYWRLGVSVVLVVAAIVLGATVFKAVRSPGNSSSGLARPTFVGGFASGLSLFGIAWWVIRGGGILLSDHEVAFKVVHTVLGLITIGLSALVLWATRPAEGR